VVPIFGFFSLLFLSQLPRLLIIFPLFLSDGFSLEAFFYVAPLYLLAPFFVQSPVHAWRTRSLFPLFFGNITGPSIRPGYPKAPILSFSGSSLDAGFPCPSFTDGRYLRLCSFFLDFLKINLLEFLGPWDRFVFRPQSVALCFFHCLLTCRYRDVFCF